MRVLKVLSLLLLLSVMLSLVGGAGAQTNAEVIAPQIFLRGIHLAEGVRYTASFVKPSDSTVLRNISVEITLPADAAFTQMLVSQQVQFDVIRINNAGQFTLIWQIARIEGNIPLDSFSFTVAEPLTGELEFYIEWQGEDGTQFFENFFEQPPLVIATEDDGQVAPPMEDFQFAFKTGVQVLLPAPETPYIANIRILPIDFNPPAELGDIWWCSLLEIGNLPEGTVAQVIVPLRRPVAPFTALQLFQQQADGSWLLLEGTGLVTADGQYVQYTHPGGIVATGGDSEIQQEAKSAEQVAAESGIAIAPSEPLSAEAQAAIPTPTPLPTLAPPANPPQLISASVVINPAEDDASVAQVFGVGGLRVAIYTEDVAGIRQCQIGRINCAVLVRRIGNGFR